MEGGRRIGEIDSDREVTVLLFHSQDLGRIDRCGAVRGDESGNNGSDNQDSRGHDQDYRTHSLDVVELGFDIPHAEVGRGNPDGEAERDLKYGVAHDLYNNTEARGTERHANANFTRLPSNGI